MGLVWKAVHHFKGRGLEDDDLFQTGCLGLIKAAKRFDADRGLQFSTYAFPTIIGEIKTALRDNSCIRVSRSLKTLAMHAKKERDTLQNKLGREVGINELAEYMNCDKVELVAALSAVAATTEIVPFDSDTDSDDADSDVFGADKIAASPETEDDWATTIDLKNRINALSGKEKALFKLRYFDGESQAQTAAHMGMSQAQVSRIEKGILLKIKEQA